MVTKLYDEFIKVWGEEYKEIFDIHFSTADKFLSMDSAYVLMKGDQIVSAVFLKYANLRNKLFETSWALKDWNEKTLADLRSPYEHASILTHFFCVKEFRGKDLGGFKASFPVIASAVMHYYFSSSDDIVLAITRKNRGVDKTAEMGGGVYLDTINLGGINEGGLTVELTKFPRHKVEEKIKFFPDGILELFKRREVYGSGRISKDLRRRNEKNQGKDRIISVA